MRKIAIIGAGIAGLTAANLLKDYAEITVFEKARGVSGRMSTRYADPYFFDHGAQYFTVKSDEFRNFLKPMIDENIVKNWHANFVEIKDNKIINSKAWDNKYKHYVGSPRMNAVAQYLAKDINIHIKTRVGSVLKLNNQWQLSDEDNKLLGNYDWVIFAIPSDQLQQLLPKNICFFDAINSIKMSGCFSLMLGFDKDISLGFDTAMVHDDIISWISLNSSKPQRNTPTCLLIHSSNKWADKHIDDDREDILKKIFDKTQKILNIDLSNPRYKTLHAWRYANISKQDTPGYFIDKSQAISACGDWCIKGKVEAAFMSAFKLANQIKRDFLNE